MVLLEVSAGAPYGALIHLKPKAAEGSHPRKWWSHDARKRMNSKPLTHSKDRAAPPGLQPSEQKMTKAVLTSSGLAWSGHGGAARHLRQELNGNPWRMRTRATASACNNPGPMP